jgi:hypothetical protein
MKKKKVALPNDWRSPRLQAFLQSRPGVLFSNWIFQGMRYMNRYEVLHRLVLETCLILLLFLASSRGLSWPAVLAALVAVLLGHTVFWLFNGHFFVLMRYLSERHNDPQRFLSFIEGLHERVKGREFLLAVVGFGSLSRNTFSPSSDFDVRFLMRRGVLNRVKAFNLCALERARAFVQRFPLDIYVFDRAEISQKIRGDEPPIIFWDPEGLFGLQPDQIGFEQVRARLRRLITGAEQTAP